MNIRYLNFDIAVEMIANKVFFRVEDVAAAVGYSKASSLMYHLRHLKPKQKYTNTKGQVYVKAPDLMEVAKRATRTKLMLDFALWAKQATREVIERHKAVDKVAETLPKKKPVSDPWPFLTKNNVELIGLKEAGAKLGMSVSELIAFLVSEGYAKRYASNNNISWTSWFKELGYGTLPVIKDEKGERTSNVAKLTKNGLEFITNRLKQKQEAGVMAFAKTSANERDKLESEMDALIQKTFSKFKYNKGYSGAFTTQPEYRIEENDLIKKVKEVVAQVKLKEKKNGI